MNKPGNCFNRFGSGEAHHTSLWYMRQCRLKYKNMFCVPITSLQYFHDKQQMDFIALQGDISARGGGEAEHPRRITYIFNRG